MVMLLFRPCAAVRAGPLLRTTSRMLVVSPRRSARPVAVATEAAVPVFDERLVSEDPELVKRSLLRRKAGDALIASVDRIGELTAERASAVSEGNTARMEKKTLSQKIGGHMKAGEQDEAAALKVEVAKLNEVAGASNPAPAPEHNHEPEPEPKPSAEPQPVLCRSRWPTPRTPRWTSWRHSAPRSSTRCPTCSIHARRRATTRTATSR